MKGCFECTRALHELPCNNSLCFGTIATSESSEGLVPLP
jgi:hypothetical protein